MSKTPAEYSELFSQIEKKMTSKNADDLVLVVTPEFKDVVVTLISDLQSVAPGMEGMMGFARANGFTQSAVSGIWMAVGIAASTEGPRQKDWIRQAGDLYQNVGGERGFIPMVLAMMNALNITRSSDRSSLFFPDPLVVDADHSSQPKIDIDEILSQMKESPEVAQAIRDLAMSVTIEPGKKKPSEDDGFGL